MPLNPDESGPKGGAPHVDGEAAVHISGEESNSLVPRIYTEKVHVLACGVHLMANCEPVVNTSVNHKPTNCEDDMGSEGSCKVKSLHHLETSS